MQLLGGSKPKKLLAFPIRDLTDQHNTKLQGKHVHFASNNYGFSNWPPYPAGSFPKPTLTVATFMSTYGSFHEESWIFKSGLGPSVRILYWISLCPEKTLLKLMVLTGRDSKFCYKFVVAVTTDSNPNRGYKFKFSLYQRNLYHRLN